MNGNIDQNKDLFNVKQASEYMNVSIKTIYNMTSKGIISHYKLNNKLVHIKKSECDRLLYMNYKPSYSEIESSLKY